MRLRMFSLILLADCAIAISFALISPTKEAVGVGVKAPKGAEVFFDENTLSVYIKRIREKIEDDPRNPQYIITQRGLGYKWNKAVNKE